jgi:UDP-N-acetylmuramoyl-tripeptide--D-alanyl-D-alanine ligase
MADTLWTASELAAVFGTPAEGAMPEGVGGISIDTRTAQPGDLFFAIKGDRTDGHDYLEQAFAAGAALAVVRQDFGGKADGPLIRVSDTLEAMSALGRAGRTRSQAKIIAVTGSVGKTSTKEMLRLLLGRLGRVHASDKSYNNHWGVPLSLARLPREAEFAVFEIGMNHAGEITPLTRMVRPHVAIITTIAPVHIEFFDGIEGIAEAKAEIFQGVVNGGDAVLNRDNDQFALLARRAAEAGVARILAFGRSGEADWQLTKLTPQNGGSEVHAQGNGEDTQGLQLTYRIGAPGEHFAMNSLAALAAVEAVGGDVTRAAPALAEFGAPAGRGAQTAHDIGAGSITLIDESYNANPASMGAAFKVLGSFPSNEAARRIAVIGDMLELGERSDALHEGLAAPIEEAGIDIIFCCGPHMGALFRKLPSNKQGAWAETSERLKDTVLGAIRPGDAIMIKGSLGSRMGLLIDAIKQTYPQRATARTIAAE